MSSPTFKAIEKQVHLSILLAQLPEPVVTEIKVRAYEVISHNQWPHLTRAGQKSDEAERYVKLVEYQARAVLERANQLI